MERRDFLGLSLGAVCSALLPSACRTQTDTPLRIACHVWPGYEFMFLAKRENWLSPNEIQLIETGSATESLQLIASGRADGAALTLDELLKGRERGIALCAALVFDISMGADVLLAKPSIDSLDKIKGKRIGYEPSAVGELMLYQALTAAGLTREDITPVHVTFDQHSQAWSTEAIDALITFEPTATEIESAGGLRLFDSSRMPDTIFDVLAVTPSAIERCADALHQLVSAHFQGLESFRKNPYDTIYRMAKHLNLSAKEGIGSFKGLELPNPRRNFVLLQGNPSPLFAAAQTLCVALAKAGILDDRKIDLTQLTTSAFIPLEA